MSKLFTIFLFLILLNCSKDEVLTFNQCKEPKNGYNKFRNMYEDIIIEINFSKKILKETRIFSESHLNLERERIKNLLTEEQLKKQIKKKEEEIYLIKSSNNGIVEAISESRVEKLKLKRNILFNIKDKKYEYSSSLTNIKSQFDCR